MVRTYFISAITITLLLFFFLSGCAVKARDTIRSGVGNLEEFEFIGGTVKNGRVLVDPGFSVEQNPESKVVFLKKQNTNDPGIEIDCSCFIEGHGSCFPVVTEGDGSVDVSCAALSCSGKTMNFCVMDITPTNTINLKFRTF